MFAEESGRVLISQSENSCLLWLTAIAGIWGGRQVLSSPRRAQLRLKIRQRLVEEDLIHWN